MLRLSLHLNVSVSQGTNFFIHLVTLDLVFPLKTLPFRLLLWTPSPLDTLLTAAIALAQYSNMG
jgi:hypothetical protein